MDVALLAEEEAVETLAWGNFGIGPNQAAEVVAVTRSMKMYLSYI